MGSDTPWVGGPIGSRILPGVDRVSIRGDQAWEKATAKLGTRLCAGRGRSFCCIVVVSGHKCNEACGCNSRPCCCRLTNRSENRKTVLGGVRKSSGQCSFPVESCHLDVTCDVVWERTDDHVTCHSTTRHDRVAVLPGAGNTE